MGGVGGQYFGGLIGCAFGGPAGAAAGMIAGGVIGGFLGLEAAHSVSPYVTAAFFDIPRTQAIENAYKTLGVKFTATNQEINESFEELNQMYREQGNNGHDNWVKLQYAMAIIHEDRR